MPFKSEAQRRYLWKNKPELAKEFESKTGTKKLPKKVPKAEKARVGKVKKI